MAKTEKYGLINQGPWDLGNNIVTADNTDTAVTSPVSVASGAITTLTVPDRAVEMIICSSADLRISEDSTMAQYFVLLYNTVIKINVADMAYVYLKGDALACTVQFMFSEI